MNHRKLSAGETAGTYRITDTVTEAELLSIAKAFARRRLAKGRKITQPTLAFEYLQILLQDYEHEVFSAIFLDTQHRVIQFEELFRGTIDAANVYPREVVKQALAHNAAVVILVHNHPSGEPEPSDTDRRITQHLKEALGLVDVKVIDHIVVGSEGCESFAERGFL
ncbi:MULTISPECIES: JAB domain-containing protein [Halomonas]|uniref:JAB domain-containing protein n=1 Tax=Halomonas TaxID=2745 RepID=UPI001C94FBA5|nr:MULTISPECIES: DNA repair protein RadC [Halomonas]MBY6207473.1 DNA repair protein RadC [Halomonas sp. DP3Y7-2]MBY6228282.1 DNA repair protein RadC [Halomonas sp. DP3Y7-1]MCA0916347.1 DNA repair protein RadC [Halomonas denitrificans]